MWSTEVKRAMLEHLPQVALAVLGRWARQRRVDWKTPLSLGLTAALCFLSVNLDTLSARWTRGPNPHAVERDPTDVETHAFKPSLLVSPSNQTHRWKAMRILGGIFQQQALTTSEFPSGYVGLVAGTLIVWGARDRIIDPSCAEVFSKGIAGSHLVVMPDTGHGPMLERPKELAKLFEHFVAEH